MSQHRRCCCARCRVTRSRRDFLNQTLVAGSPPAARGSAWTREEYPVAADCAYTFANHNCFQDLTTDTPHNFQIRGHKKVSNGDGKVWHGMRPWTFCASDCIAETVRYLGLAVESAVSWTNDIEGARTDNASYGATVNQTSGKGTRSAPTHTHGVPGSAPEFDLGILEIRHGCEWTYVDSGDTERNQIANFCVAFLNGATFEDAYSAQFGGGHDATGGSIDSVTVSGDVIAFEITITYPPGYTFFAGEVVTHISFSATLSSPYIAADLFTDAIAGLAPWRFDSDAYWNWRMDGWLALCIIACYDETVATTPEEIAGFATTLDDYRSPIGSPPYSSWDPMGWVDMRVYAWIFPPGEDQTTAAATELRLLFSGAVIHNPSPGGAKWPDKSFSFEHQNWEWTGGFWVLVSGAGHGSYTGASGEESTDAAIDPTATRWSDQIEASENPGGAGIIYRDPGSLFAAKSAEVLEIFRSYNPFGVGGDMRFTLDTGKNTDGTIGNTTSCISTIVDNDTVQCGLSAIGDLAAGELALWWGDPDPDAITNHALLRRVASITDLGGDLAEVAFDPIVTTPGVADYELFQSTPLVLAAMDARRWNEVTQGEFGRVGRLRWQEGSPLRPAPFAIKGRMAVTVATAWDGAKTILSIAANNLINNDKVDLLPADYVTPLGSNLTVTKIDATHFSVPANIGVTAKWARSNGAPAYTWNTTRRRGNFVINRTVTSLVDGALVYTVTNTDAVKLGSCPVVVCTPNEDAPTGAYEITYPSSVTPTTCGWMEWIRVKQFVTRPDYQEPVSCDGDVDMCPPRVEARTAKIAGSPDLPAGCGFELETGVPSGAGHTDARPDEEDVAWLECVEI